MTLATDVDWGHNQQINGRRREREGEDGRLRDRWTTTVASTIAYSMCKSRLSRLFLGFNRQRRGTARERGQGTSLGSFVGTSLVGVGRFLSCTATPVVPRSLDYTSGMANPRQKRKQKSSSHRPVRHAKHAKKNLKKMPRKHYSHEYLQYSYSNQYSSLHSLFCILQSKSTSNTGSQTFARRLGSALNCQTKVCRLVT